MDLFRLTAHEAGELLRRREVSSLELTRTALGRISSVDSQVRAFVTVCEDQALQQARAADERLKNGNNTPLTGSDLRMAIDAVLSGRAVNEDQKPSIGCNIKWKPGNEPDYE